MKISIFELKGEEINLTFNNGTLAYTFEHEGNRYGNAVKVESRKALDIASSAFGLLTNALETIEKLHDNK